MGRLTVEDKAVALARNVEECVARGDYTRVAQLRQEHGDYLVDQAINSIELTVPLTGEQLMRLRPYDGALGATPPPTNSTGQPPKTSDKGDPDDIAQRRREAMLRQAVDQERTRRKARRIVDADDLTPVDGIEFTSLEEQLQEDLPPLQFRVEGWQPEGARVVLAAQYKAGKTTVTGNLVRCLVDGDRFLSRFEVTPVDGRVVILDFEMSKRQGLEWLDDQGIRNRDKVHPVWLRGKASAFDILDPGRREWWAARLVELRASYIVWDCLRPVADALGLSELSEMGPLLVAFDQLCDRAGVLEATALHHMGHTGERSRGDSRIRDWPDVEWRLVRKSEDPASERFVSAFGRDVEQPEARLQFNPDTRHLTLVDGNRATHAAQGAFDDVIHLINEAPGLNKRQIEEALSHTDHSQKAVRDAVKNGVGKKYIDRQPGPNRSQLHSLTGEGERLVELSRGGHI